jgi:hypothetical protein
LSSKTGENVERAFKEMTDTLFEDYWLEIRPR